LQRIAEAGGQGAATFLKVSKSAEDIAAQMDRESRQGRALPPTAGLIISIKALFDVAGEVTMSGSILLRDAAPAEYDAEAVHCVLRARPEPSLRNPAQPLRPRDRTNSWRLILRACESFGVHIKAGICPKVKLSHPLRMRAGVLPSPPCASACRAGFVPRCRHPPPLPFPTGCD